MGLPGVSLLDWGGPHRGRAWGTLERPLSPLQASESCCQARKETMFALGTGSPIEVPGAPSGEHVQKADELTARGFMGGGRCGRGCHGRRLTIGTTQVAGPTFPPLGPPRSLAY